jgi:methylmalonyl-CoA mutase
MKEQLKFNEFDPVSEKQWKQKIQADLKGLDYNDTLISEGPGGIHIKPFYHRESAPKINVPSRATSQLYVSQKIYVADEKATRDKINDIAERGAQGCVLIIDNKNIDLNLLFSQVPEQFGIQVHLSFYETSFVEQLQKLLPQCYVHIDPLHHLVATGNWWKNQTSDMTDVLAFAKAYEGYFSNISVRTSTYTDAGADEVQELAYYLAHLNEYLNYFNDNDGLDILRSGRKRVNIDCHIGSNYFYQIAKYRSYRLLTQALGKQYDLELSCYITASPSPRNKSLLDYNVNMLRTTTECMSAINGGADTVYNLPYDDFFNKSNEFGERIARNQLLVLKDEAYLDKVSNVADGSYFIDSLTQQFCDKALELFKMIEEGGGLISQLHDGKIQKNIAAKAEAEQKAFNNQEKVLVGVNKYQPSDLHLKAEYEVFPFLKKRNEKTLIAPVVARRLAEELEKEQLKNL